MRPSTPSSADCRSVSLTEGYRNKLPFFHKLFLKGVENFPTISNSSALITSNDDSDHKKAAQNRAAFENKLKNAVAKLSRDLFQCLLIDIEVRVHILHIFAIFQSLHQPDHLGRLLTLQLDIGIRNHRYARGDWSNGRFL